MSEEGAEHSDFRRLPVEGLIHAAVIFAPLAFGCVEPWSAAILQLLLVPLPAVYLASGRNLTRPSHPLLLMFGGAAFLAALQATHSFPAWGPAAWVPFTADRTATVRKILLLIAFISAAWTVPRLAADPAARLRLAWSLFFAAFLVAVIGILHGDQNINRSFYGIRPVLHGGYLFAPFYNRNHAASFMAGGFLVGAGLAVSKLAEFRSSNAFSQRSNAGASLMLVAFMLAILAAGVVKSGSRGGAGALLVGAAVAGMFTIAGMVRSRGRVYGVAAAVIVAGTLVWLIHGQERKLRLDRGTLQRSWTYRAAMAEGSLGLFLDFPAAGIGAGALRAAFPPYQLPPLEGIVEHSHNDGLEAAAEGGWPGVLVFLIGAILLLARGISRWRESPPWEKAVIACWLGALLVPVAHGLVDFPLQIPANAFAFLVMGAALIAPETGISSSSPRRGTVAFAASCAVATMILSFRPVTAAWQASRVRAFPPAMRVELLRRAIALSPEPELRVRLAIALAEVPTDSNGGRSRNLVEAVELVSAALAAEPVNPRFRQEFSKLLWRMGRKDDARELYVGL